MSAAAAASLIDDFTGKPDHGLVRDAALESQIDNAFNLIASAPNREASLEPLTELSLLILQRSPIQMLKLELERRMRTRR